MDFVIGGFSSVVACIFTNPLDVVKIRMQLQGELKLKDQQVVYYKNVFHAPLVIIKHEGFLALQKGLVASMCLHMTMNGIRLGTYQFGETRGYITNEDGNLVLYKSVLLGGAAGVVGQFLGSPFFMVKTHLQSEAFEAIAVGHQHHHGGTWRALKRIYDRNGVAGLFRGAGASIPRAFVGSTSQLTSFRYTKEFLNDHEYFSARPILGSLCASMVGGVAISVMMTPFDLILTRLYNQPIGVDGRGLLYRSYVDCVLKILKTEGVLAFYKGIGPVYVRLGPHTMLCLVFWDELNSLYKKHCL